MFFTEKKQLKRKLTAAHDAQARNLVLIHKLCMKLDAEIAERTRIKLCAEQLQQQYDELALHCVVMYGSLTASGARIIIPPMTEAEKKIVLRYRKTPLGLIIEALKTSIVVKTPVFLEFIKENPEEMEAAPDESAAGPETC